MTIEKKETTPQPMPQFYPQYIGPAEDEINLLDLWGVLVKRWRLIFSVSVLSVVIMVAYALSLPKIYQAEVYLLPPLKKDLQGLQGIKRRDGMQGMEGIKSIRLKTVFGQFRGNLKSLTTQRLFSEAEKIKSFSFHHSVSFKESREENDISKISVILEWSDQDQITGLLNRYIETVALQTKAEILDGIRAELLQNKIIIEHAVASKRGMAAQRRADEIARLNEALFIATELKVVNSLLSPAFAYISTIDGGQEDSKKGFQFGSTALKVQISALTSRKSDDPYIMGLRALEEQLGMLNNQLSAINDDFSVVRVDQKAYRPDFPIEPNKRKITAIGGVLGLILGIFAALFFNFLENNRKEQESEG